MDITYSLILNAYSMMMLVVICVSALKLADKKSLQDKLYLLILLATMLMLVIDIASRLDGNSDPSYVILNHVGNFLVFLLGPVLPSVWLLYVHVQIFNDVANTRRLIYLLLTLNIVNDILLILTQFYGWYYYIDANNIYHRGPLFLLPAFIALFMMMAALVIIVKSRAWLERRTFLSLLFFPLLPLVCILLQIAYYGVSLMLNGIAISLLIVYLNIQHHNIHTDHLTGIHNRKKLDVHLSRKIGTSTTQRKFAAIMLDLDNFKTINDAHGHDMGDKALVDVVQILKRCIRANDFIARYGGDEFVILLDISSKADLEAMIQRINKNAEAFNASSSRPYAIQFSMGYTLYDTDSRMNTEEFIKQLDSLMYENKQGKKHMDSLPSLT